MLAQSLFGRGISLISQLVLAKILIPEDFGLVGLAYTITTLFNVFINIGIDNVLQQRRERMKYWITQAFWLGLGLSVIVALSMSLYAPFGAKAYNNDAIVPLVWIFALSVPLTTLAIIPQVFLQAQLRFKYIATYNSFELISTQLLTILLAWLGLGAKSFIIPITLMAFVRAIVFWTKTDLTFRPFRRTKGTLVLFKKALTVLGSRLCTTLIGQGDYILLGLLTTTHVIGVYYFAFKLAAQPMKMLAGNFTNVLFPALTALAADKTRQRDAAFKTARLLAVVTTPLCLMQAALAEPALAFLFGAKWLESVIFVQILSVGLLFDAPSWAAGSLLSARGEFARSFKYLGISCLCFFIMITTGGLLFSARGVAMAVALYYTIHPLVFTALVFCREGLSLTSVLSLFFKPFALGIASIGAAWFLSNTFIPESMHIAQIAAILSVGGLSYLALLRVALPDLFNDVIHRARQTFLKRRQIQ